MSYNQRVILSIAAAFVVVAIIFSLLPSGALIPSVTPGGSKKPETQPSASPPGSAAVPAPSKDEASPGAVTPSAQPRTPARPSGPPAAPRKSPDAKPPASVSRQFPAPDTTYVYHLPYEVDAAYVVHRAAEGELKLMGENSDADERTDGAVNTLGFAMPKGTPVLAARGGRVLPFQKDLVMDWSQMAIEHEDGTVAIYGNIDRSRARVAVGGSVRAGQSIVDVAEDAFLHVDVFRRDGGIARTFPTLIATRESPGGQILEQDAWYLRPESTVDVPTNVISKLEAVDDRYHPREEFEQLAPVTIMVRFNLPGSYPFRIEFQRPHIDTRIQRPIEWHESRQIAWCRLNRDDTRYHAGTWKAIAFVDGQERGSVSFTVLRKD